MPTTHKTRTCNLLAAIFLFAAVSHVMAIAEEPGVSHALAIARAARISNLRYQLSFILKEQASAIEGTETVTFESKSAGDLPIDYRDGVLHSATLNGKAIPADIVSGHLNLPTIAGENTLALAFTSNAAPAGNSITRYEDKDDGSEYFYTLFVPMDASMAFPCFDQPDLKARFTLDLEHPAGWTAIGNTAPLASDSTHTKFAETRPISTYLFAFAAGPFASVRSSQAAEPTLYVRKSQLARAQQEAPQVQQMAARGIQYFSDYFAQPFPFPKYDLVLIPGFPFGGMEHAGATFLNEDSVLFRSVPTANDYFRRNTLVLHETCHQWFGDLVTMRWFNDLWLKEGFAQYMAYKSLAQLEPASNPWKHFYEDIKPLAYGIDETQGTTPIFQNIANLKDAKSAYGAIVYQKAPAVLKQLEYFLGDEAFRNGLRLYLKQHAYSNAEWTDLVKAFETASDQLGQHQDVQAWAGSWITHRGMPEVTVNYGCNSGKITDFTISQKDVLQDKFTWPMANNILFISTVESANAPLTLHTDIQTLRVNWNAATFHVGDAIGKRCPNLVFANEGDFGYGRFLLDAPSAAVAALLFDPDTPRESNPSIFESVSNQTDPLRRSMIWGALWDNVHVAKAPPSGYIDVALKSLPGESDESLARIQGARIAIALHSYLSEPARNALVPRAESVVSDRMLNAPTLGLRIVNFRTFTSIAKTPAALNQMEDLLAGKLSIPGLELKSLDRWNLVGHLIAMNDPEASALFTAEKQRDHSGEGQKYAYAVEAGFPSAEIKARYFDEYLHSPTLQEDWITQSLRSFNSWNQSALTQSYLVQALNELPDIKQHRKIFFLGAWLGAFIDGQNNGQGSLPAQAAVRTWLAGKNIDPDLRLKVLEASDSLDRTVLIHQAFPE
jgi:aminopeptidase N